jgi:hypothetical protein
MREPNPSGYRPMMPAERAEHLREWHEQAVAGGRRDAAVTVTEHGRTFDVWTARRMACRSPMSRTD